MKGIHTLWGWGFESMSSNVIKSDIYFFRTPTCVRKHLNDAPISPI